MTNVIVSTPTSIKIGGALVGRTFGRTTITRNATYEDVKRPDSPHAFKTVKKNVSFEVTFNLEIHTAANLGIVFDVDVPGGVVNFDQTAVQEKTLEIIAGGITYSFARIVQVGTAGLPYSDEEVTVLPLALKVFLIDEDGGDTVPDLCSLDGYDLPGQFNYAISRPKRFSVMQTFGGVRRSAAASILDETIEFSAVNLTLAQKLALEAIYEGHIADLILFTGLHGESAWVWFEEWEAPKEQDGYWQVAGILRTDITGGT